MYSGTTHKYLNPAHKQYYDLYPSNLKTSDKSPGLKQKNLSQSLD